MRPKSSAYIWDMCQAAAYIEAKVEGLTFEQFLAEIDVRTIVERQLEIIGEAGRRLFDHDPDTAALIPGLKDAIGMRNIIAHGYDDIDYEDIWLAITGPLEQLGEVAAQLLESAR